MGSLPVDSRNLRASVAATQHAASDVLSNRHRFERLITAFEISADFVTVNLSVLLAWAVYGYLHVGRRLHYNPKHILIATVIFSLVFIFLMERDGAYESANSLLRIRETERTLRISVMAFGLVFIGTVLVAHLVSRAIVLNAFILVPLAITIEKHIVSHLVRSLHARGYGIQNVLIYGAGETGKRLFSALIRSPKFGLRPIAIIDDNHELAGRLVHESGYRKHHSLAVQSGPVTRDVLREMDAHLILVGIPNIAAEKLNALADEAFAAGSAIAFVPLMGNYPETSMPGYADLDGIMVASLVPPTSKPWYELVKRLFDAIASGVLLVLTSPVLILVAVIVRLDSPGPVFFHQTRIGKKGVPFEMHKFRSMRVDSPQYGYHPTSAQDSRITRSGKWLRRTSLDELPQLLNVFRGQMSLVGPRPEMPFIVEKYDARQRQRLQVTPGITGLWQISADRAALIHENLQYDLYYIRNRSFFMDFAILLHTALFAMNGV